MNLPVTASPLRAWTTSDKQLMPFTEWLPGDRRHPKAVLVAIHGLGGTSRDFKPLGEKLARVGFAVQAMEMRGQGNDPMKERRGVSANEKLWYRDISEFVAKASERYPRSPVFLLGESFGAALITHLAASLKPDQEAIRGLIFLAPVIDFRKVPSPFFTTLAKAFMLFFPRFKADLRWFVRGKTKADSFPLCRDEEHLEEMDNDPTHMHVFALQFLSNVQRLISTAKLKARSIHLPSLVLYAGRDLFIRPEQSKAFGDLIAATDKESVAYPESCHLLLHDPVSNEVVEKIASWLEQHAAAYALAGQATN